MPAPSGAPVATAGAPLKASSTAPTQTGSFASSNPSFTYSQNMGEENQGIFYMGDQTGADSQTVTRYEGDAAQAEAEYDPYPADKPGLVTWIFLFVGAGTLDLIGLIPVVGEIVSPIAVSLIRLILKWTGATRGGWVINVITATLAISEVVPGVSEFLPGCTAEVLSAYLIKKAQKEIQKKLREITPVARQVQQVAGAIPVPQAQAVGAVAGVVAGTGEALDRGESLDQAVVSGTVEGVQGAAAGLAGGAGGAAAGAAGGAAGSAGASSAAAGGASKAAGPGVGAQYGVGKNAGSAGAKGAPVKARMPGAQDEESLLQQLKEHAEEEEFFPGTPLVTEDLYADAPVQQTGNGRKQAQANQSKKMKPTKLPDTKA